MDQFGFKRLKGWRLLVLLYGLLLISSHLFQLILPSADDIGYTGRQKIELKTVEGDSLIGKSGFQITYRNIYNGEKRQPPVILLLAGGPEGSEIFDNLIPVLANHYRLLIPDLPGYGTPLEDLPDYSFEALSSYTTQLLITVGIHRVHVVGYGLGGASAIHLANADSNMVQSVSLISSIGVQELELMGSYTLNHAIHGVQVAAVWLLHNAVPHFGLFDQLGIDVPYAKSFYESDQRPIRNYLMGYQRPMLILHGKDDGLVPLAAAKEHHRIVPHSKLVVFDGDHDIIEVKSDSVAGHILSFVESVEKGSALYRNDATKQQLKEAREPFENVGFTRFSGVSLLIIVLIIILSTLISEDLTCIGAGLLAARGLIGFWPVVGACLAGIVIGNMGVYLAGRYMGKSALRKAPFKWFISEQDLLKSTEWFRSRGTAIIISSRFLPGSRLPVYFTAGLIDIRFWKFLSCFLLSAVIWTPLIVGLSMFLGHELLRFFSIYQEYTFVIIAAIIILLIIIAKTLLPRIKD